ANRLKVFEILRVRKRVAAFDEVDAEFVQLAGEQQLVLQGKVDAFALAAVAKRGVVKENAAHGVLDERKNPEAVLRGRRGNSRLTPITPCERRRALAARRQSQSPGWKSKLPWSELTRGMEGRQLTANTSSTFSRQPGSAGSASATSPRWKIVGAARFVASYLAMDSATGSTSQMTCVPARA